MRYKIKKMIKKICQYVFFIVIVTTLFSISNAEHPAELSYLFPVPDSKFVSKSTTLILKSHPGKTLSDMNIQVTGFQSGIHNGEIVYKDNKRTFIFKPYEHFTAGEIVTVQLNGTIDYHYRFTISEKPDEEYLDSESLDQSLQSNISKFYKSSTNQEVRSVNGVVLPADFPQIRTYQYGQTAPGKIFFASNITQLSNYIIIMENDGTPYFYRRYPGYSPGSGDFKVHPTGVLSVYLYRSREYIVLDSNYQEIDSWVCGNGYLTDTHELLLLPNGHAFLIAQDWQYMDLSDSSWHGSPNAHVMGNHIQEIDENKDVVFEWRCWDNYKLTDANHMTLKASSFEYIHMNSLAIDYDGHIIASARNLSEVTKIDHQTGEMIWRFGGVNNQFEILNDEHGFSYQHYVKPVQGYPNRYLMFDNGGYHYTYPFSRAVEFQLDTINMTAEKVWEFRYTPDRYTNAMCSAQRLDNGNTFIDWTRRPPLLACEVNEAQDILFEMEVIGTSSYRTCRYEWEGMLLVPELICEGYPQFVRLIYNKFGDNNVDHYNIYGGMTSDSIKFIQSTTEAYVDLKMLQNNIDWYFKVTAVDISGTESPFSNMVQIFVDFMPPEENMIINGDFSAGISYWDFDLNGEADATMDVVNKDKKMEITIIDGGSDRQDIQLRQDYIGLLHDISYLFEFDAYADTNTLVDVRIQESEEPWTAYGRIGFVFLTNQKEHFSFPFVMESASDFNARLVFNCGLNTGNIYIDNVVLKQNFSSSEETDEQLPLESSLEQNYPNPFNNSTEFHYKLSRKSKIKIVIYNILGQKVKTLIYSTKPAGNYHIIWDGKNDKGMDLASGIYLYRISTDYGFTKTRKLLLIK